MNKRVKLLRIFAFFAFTNSFLLHAQTKEGFHSISIDELKNHMYFLASDFLGGRVSYENGYSIAAEYCASQFKSIGLQPVLKDKNGKSTFFQDLPIIKRTMGKDFRIYLVNSKDTFEFKSPDECKLVDKLRNIPNPNLDFVFVGYGIEEPEAKWNDYDKLEIKDKAVVLMLGTPQKDGKPVLPENIDNKYKSINGLQAKLYKLIDKKPGAVLIIADKSILTQIPWAMIPNYSGGDQYTSANEYKTDEDFYVPAILLLKPESMSKIFKNQIYNPENIEQKGLKGYKTFHLKDLKFNLNLSISEPVTVYTKNVVALLKGSDETLSKQYVTVGAHLDHVPKINGQVCNGADDDASGSVGVIELSEAMTYQPPRRSVLFILYAGEELGLIGSSYFVNNSPVPVNDIVVNINLDMIGRTSAENKENRAHYVMIHKEYLNVMTNFINDVNKKGVNWPLIFKDSKSLPGDSDHSSFNKKGIPNFHFFSGQHADLHLPTDDAENIDYEKMQKLIQLTYDLAYKFANLDQLPFKK